MIAMNRILDNKDEIIENCLLLCENLTDVHNITLEKMAQLTQELANAAEERGNNASGISYIQNGKVKIFKKAKPAHKMRFNFPDGTSAIMGHTRFTTQGNQKFNYNNHPFYGSADKDFAFAHNDVLYNDKELRRDKNLSITRIETDSYIAVQIIEQSGKNKRNHFCNKWSNPYRITSE